MENWLTCLNLFNPKVPITLFDPIMDQALKQLISSLKNMNGHFLNVVAMYLWTVLILYLICCV